MGLDSELPARRSAIQAALFLLLVMLLAGVSIALGRADGSSAELGVRGLMVNVLVLAALYMGLVLTLLRVHRQAWSTLGLDRMRPLAVVGFGLIGCAMAYAANLVAVMLYLALTRPDLARLGEQKMAALDPLASLPLAAVLPLALLVGVYEELAFRGFLLSRLRAAFAARMRARPAALAAVIVSSAAFAIGHAYQGAIGIAQTAAAGVAFALLALWRKSIWPCIFAHVAIDSFGMIALRFIRPALETLAPGQ
jgi:uncharacterized protein